MIVSQSTVGDADGTGISVVQSGVISETIFNLAHIIINLQTTNIAIQSLSNLLNSGIFANEDALLSAVSNIARNALRHSPKGGTVRLRLQESGDSVEWACADEGPGIPENELEQIFSPFVRGSKESTGTGFGLGLAIAQSAVRAHGGLIRAKNMQPHGLEVIISIPKTPAPKHFGSPEEETRP